MILCLKRGFLTDAQLLGECNSLSLIDSELVKVRIFFKRKSCKASSRLDESLLKTH